MSLHYTVMNTRPVIGSKDSSSVATGVTLESTYQAESPTVATKSFSTSGMSKLNLDVLYTMGAAETSNSVEVKVEASPDNVNFFRIANDTTTLGASVLNAREFTFVGVNAAAATISIFLDIAYKYMRVSCKETGVAANKGTVYVEATVSGE